jgi:nucleoside-diphosphate-sugar epimerase
VGATGYIGSRLVPALLDAGYTVRCLVRSEEKLKARTWSNRPGVVDPVFWTENRPVLRWWAGMENKETPCPERARIIRRA